MEEDLSGSDLFAGARRGSYLPIQLTVEPIPVSRLHRCRSLSFAGGPAADGNRGNTAVIYILVDDAGRRSPSLSTEATETTADWFPRRRHGPSRNFTDVLNHLPRAHSRTDRRTVERCLRGRDAASTPRRLKRRPVVA